MRSGAAMQRHVLAASALLVLGGLLSVGTAWAIALSGLRGGTSESGIARVGDAGCHIVRLSRPGRTVVEAWRIVGRADDEDEGRYLEFLVWWEEQTAGAFGRRLIGGWGDIESNVASRVLEAPAGTRVVGFGFPFACMWYGVNFEEDRPSRRIYAVEVRRGLALDSLPARRHEWVGALPLGIHWYGLIGNSMFYGAAVGGVIALACFGRRALRQRRSACVRCAYPRPDAVSPCPECGHVPV